MRSAFLLAFVVLVLGLALAGTERNEEEAQQKLADEMHEIWNESGGEWGWPPAQDAEKADD